MKYVPRMGPAIAVAVVAVYAAVLAVIITLAFRWSRSILEKKQDIVSADLAAQGGKVGAAAKSGGLYVGSDVPVEIDGKQIITNVRYVSRSYVRANLKVTGHALPWVTVYPEKGVDKWGKVIGLNKEVQTGDPLFDEMAYVDSLENEESVKRLLAPDVRAAVGALLALGFKVQFSAAGIDAFQVLHAFTTLKDFQWGAAGRALVALEKVVPRFEGVSPTAPGSKKAVALVVGILAVTAAGFIGAAALGDQLGSSLDGVASLGLVLAAALVLWTVMLFGLAALVRGQSNAMRWLVTAAVISLFGVPVFGGTCAVWLNQALDDAPATTQETQIFRKYSSKNGQSFTVNGWDGQPGRPSIDSCWKHYQQYQVGDTVTLTIHPGKFGIRWAEKL
ncbi:MAG: hypothetical protein QM817_36020 [Archangium sp.]